MRQVNYITYSNSAFYWFNTEIDDYRLDIIIGSYNKYYQAKFGSHIACRMHIHQYFTRGIKSTQPGWF